MHGPHGARLHQAPVGILALIAICDYIFTLGTCLEMFFKNFCSLLTSTAEVIQALILNPKKIIFLEPSFGCHQFNIKNAFFLFNAGLVIESTKVNTIR